MSVSIGIDDAAAALPEGIRLIRELGEGGQRKVFEALVDTQRVALKLMRAEDTNRAEREVAIGCTFDHPNLARVLDEDLSGLSIGGEDYIYFTETLIEGEPLTKTPLPLDGCQALRLTANLVSAVTYLWTQHNVVHRDIKPLNIMVANDDRFVLLDVGYGRHQGQPSLTSGAYGPGSPGYLAPEQLVPSKGRDLDYRTDFFVIGIVLYQVLKDALPFDPVDPDYHARVLSGAYAPMDGIDAPIAQLLSRLLAEHPHGRPRLGHVSDIVQTVSKEVGCS